MAVEQPVTKDDINKIRMELRGYAVGWAHMMCDTLNGMDKKKKEQVDVQKVRNIANNIITDNYWRIKFKKASVKLLKKLKAEYETQSVA